MENLEESGDKTSYQLFLLLISGASKTNIEQGKRKYEI